MSNDPGGQAPGNIVLHDDVDLEDEMQTYLSVLIETEEWDAVEERLLSHPHELQHRSGTALRLALEGGECPFHLIRIMIEMDPTLPSQTDHNQVTPLHTACAGNFAYNPLVILTLLVAYPQAVLMRERVEHTTPLHMLLTLGGNVNMTCLRLLLDVAYSAVAGLPTTFVLAVEVLDSPLEESGTTIAQKYPPLVTALAQDMALSHPNDFPAFMRPLLHLTPPPPDDSLLPLTRRAPQFLLLPNQERLLLIQDRMKHTPLHIAARRCLRKQVVQLLLEQDRYPGANEACFVLNHKERCCPLFYCAAYSAPIDAAECIFQHNQKAVHVYDEQYGITPYQVAANSPNFTLAEKALELKSDRTDPSEAIQPLLFVEPNSFAFYNQLDFYLCITHYQGRASKEGYYSVLHAASAVVSNPHFLKCNIRLYPWQLKQFDKDGNLPLHLACKVLRPDGINKHQYWLKKDVAKYDKLAARFIPEDRERDNPITILIGAYGKAASTLDKHWNLPLHSAVLSGKKMIDGVRSLIHAAPIALVTRNMTNGLYPFMMAAMIDDLDLTLDLLLANPQVV